MESPKLIFLTLGCGALRYLGHNWDQRTSATSLTPFGPSNRATSLNITDGYNLTVWDWEYWSGRSKSFEVHVNNVGDVWNHAIRSTKCIGEGKSVFRNTTSSLQMQWWPRTFDARRYSYWFYLLTRLYEIVAVKYSSVWPIASLIFPLFFSR